MIFINTYNKQTWRTQGKTRNKTCKMCVFSPHIKIICSTVIIMTIMVIMCGQCQPLRNTHPVIMAVMCKKNYIILASQYIYLQLLVVFFIKKKKEIKATGFLDEQDHSRDS